MSLLSTVPSLLIGYGSSIHTISRCCAPSMDVAMPAVLANWGCDDELWSKIRSKNALLKLVEDGDEAGARERLDMLRNAPSVVSSTAKPSGALELSPTLVEWGVDAALWRDVRDKQSLLDLAAAGDEDKARERIDFVRRAVKSGGSGYRLKGSVPAGFDVEVVEPLLVRRIDAKKARDFDAADALQAELQAMGVLINDRQRTWQSAEGGPALKGSLPESVDRAAAEALLARRMEAKKVKDFETADALQEELTAMGLWVDDKKQVWGAAKASPSGGTYRLKGEPPEGVDVTAVESMLARRVEAKKSRQFDAADALQSELLAMGVWVNDKQKTWEEAGTPPPKWMKKD